MGGFCGVWFVYGGVVLWLFVLVGNVMWWFLVVICVDCVGVCVNDVFWMNFCVMKSVYEFVMECFVKFDFDVGKLLIVEKKVWFVEIDVVYKGKIVEWEIFLK